MSNEDTKQQPASSEQQPAQETVIAAKPGLETLTDEDLTQVVGGCRKAGGEQEPYIIAVL